MRNLFFFLFALIFIGLGVFTLIRSNELSKKCTKEIIAVVIEVKKERSANSELSDDDYVYSPVFEFTVGEDTYRVDSPKASSDNNYKVGDKVKLLYNPNRPTEYLIKGDKSTNVLSWIFIGAGIISFFSGIYYIVTGKKSPVILGTDKNNF